MSQNINLSVAGIYTSLNDYQGLPQGALEIADNVESRYKNVLEPRRGFEELDNSNITNGYIKRISNFYVDGTNVPVCIDSEGNVK